MNGSLEMLNRERDRDRDGHDDRHCCCQRCVGGNGSLSASKLSFRDDIAESNRQFHRARLDEIPDLVSSGLIHSDQLTAIESESKHDLLSDMRGSEAAPAVANDIGWSASGGLFARFWLA